jgi:hypothetical protein
MAVCFIRDKISGQGSCRYLENLHIFLLQGFHIICKLSCDLCFPFNIPKIWKNKSTEYSSDNVCNTPINRGINRLIHSEFFYDQKVSC